MVYMLLFPGFEEVEAVVPLDLLRRAGIDVMTVSAGDRTVHGSHGIGIEADISIGEMDLTALEMIILPGGRGALEPARSCAPAMDALRFAWENQRFVAAICAAPTTLACLGITDGRQVTCYPGFEPELHRAQVDGSAACVRDGKLITAASAGCAVPFALTLIAALTDQQTADAVEQQIVIR